MQEPTPKHRAAMLRSPGAVWAVAWPRLSLSPLSAYPRPPDLLSLSQPSSYPRPLALFSLSPPTQPAQPRLLSLAPPL